MASPESSTSPPRFWPRVARALRLDPSLYDELEADATGFAQATSVVLVAGLARGVYGLEAEGAVGVVGSLIGAVIIWFAAAAVLSAVGVRWVHGTTDFGEMLRTLGFAAAPLWLLAAGGLVTGPAHLAIGIAAHAWAVAASVVAVRQALDTDTARAFATFGLAIGVGAGLLLLLGALVASCVGA